MEYRQQVEFLRAFCANLKPESSVFSVYAHRRAYRLGLVVACENLIEAKVNLKERILNGEKI